MQMESAQSRNVENLNDIEKIITYEKYNLEFLINAEAHRQYLMRGTNIEVGFYNDRIEIITSKIIEINNSKL